MHVHCTRYVHGVQHFCDLNHEPSHIWCIDSECYQLSHDGGRYHIETSPLICRANQWTSFYITVSVMKELSGLWKFVRVRFSRNFLRKKQLIDHLLRLISHLLDYNYIKPTATKIYISMEKLQQRIKS